MWKGNNVRPAYLAPLSPYVVEFPPGQAENKHVPLPPPTPPPSQVTKAGLLTPTCVSMEPRVRDKRSDSMWVT